MTDKSDEQSLLRVISHVQAGMLDMSKSAPEREKLSSALIRLQIVEGEIGFAGLPIDYSLSDQFPDFDWEYAGRNTGIYETVEPVFSGADARNLLSEIFSAFLKIEAQAKMTLADIYSGLRT